MKIFKTLSFIFVVSLMLAVGSSALADESAWFVEKMKNGEAVLDPGTTTYCNKNFKIENMGEEEAHVHVILGNGMNYAFDLLKPKETKSYQLAPTEMGGGWEESKGMLIDEARIVNATAGTSNIKVRCK